jgi:hypothetical protein
MLSRVIQILRLMGKRGIYGQVQIMVDQMGLFTNK